MMEVSMDKKYTLNGEDFTILTVAMPDRFPVVGYTANCMIWRFPIDGTGAYGGANLIEVSPYADFVIDEPVMVRDSDYQTWAPRHFAGVNVDGRAAAWNNGCTTWAAAGQKTYWIQCRRPTKEALAK